VFPRLVGEGLYGFVADGYWLDIGTPDRYLQGSFDILEGRIATRVRAGEDGVLGGPVDGDVRGPAVIGAGATVGAGSVVERAVVLEGARVGKRCVLRDCIVAPGATVADGTVAAPGSILA